MSDGKPRAYSLDKISDHQFVDQDGVSHRSPAALLGDILGVCGCGRGHDITDRAVQVLDIFAGDDNSDVRQTFFDNLTNEVIAHWLDSCGLLEHGTIFRYAWLTESGKQVHRAIHQFDCEDSIGANA